MSQDDLGLGCFVPLAQAAVTGAFFALAAFALAEMTGAFSAGWGVALFVFACAALMVWVSGLRAWRRGAYTPEPLDEFWQSAEDDHEPEPVRVEVHRENGIDFIDLPASQAQLSELASGLLSGSTFSESAWTGQGNPLFTRSQFAHLRAELIKRGLAAWNSPGTPARGVSLTAPGRAVMRKFAAMTDALPPYPRKDSPHA